MAVCEQESVGQQLFFLVNALTQQTAKGPVDSVTGKALYTLSEVWLLWQAQDFTPVVSTHTPHTQANHALAKLHSSQLA